MFCILVASSDAQQRLRGVLKRPLHGHLNTNTAGNGKADTKGDVIIDNDLMTKMSDFDELIWKMAAAGDNGYDNEPPAATSTEKRSLRWRKRRSTDGGAEKTIPRKKALTFDRFGC